MQTILYFGTRIEKRGGWKNTGSKRAKKIPILGGSGPW